MATCELEYVLMDVGDFALLYSLDTREKIEFKTEWDDYFGGVGRQSPGLGKGAEPCNYPPLLMWRTCSILAPSDDSSDRWPLQN